MTTISRQAAIEALHRCGLKHNEVLIEDAIYGRSGAGMFHQLALAIQELWDGCPSKRPVNNRVLAMEWAMGCHSAECALDEFDKKLAELEGGA
jgi:hypothetical protein